MTVILDETHDPEMRSWVASSEGHQEFPIQNLPYGVFSLAGEAPRIGVAIGESVLDLAGATDLLPPEARSSTVRSDLSQVMALDIDVRASLRKGISRLLTDHSQRPHVEPLLHPADSCQMHVPCRIGDYTDFYVGIHHAENVGRQFRPTNPLLPNYKWVPIGYLGRASSARVSGIPVRRPQGQLRFDDASAPVFEPTRRLDYELELGVWIGKGSELGNPIPITMAANHIGGLCLLNDWSARDIQSWEYQPLGPFLSKNFHSTVSPWVITLEALAPFRISQPERPHGDPQPLPYLWDEEDQRIGALGLELSIELQSECMRQAGIAPVAVSRGHANSMYWTIAQLITHHSSNGCDLNTGDLLGTGTISAPDQNGRGSLMELTQSGANPITLPTGEQRGFLADGDTVTLRARAMREGFASIGFGECRAVVISA